MSRSIWRARLARIGLASAVALVAAAAVAWLGVDQFAREPAAARTAGHEATAITAAPQQGVGGPFTLTDHTGQRVTDADFRGRHMLVYFGFTFCPDVCPTELTTMSRAIEALGPAGEAVVPVLITIDPERDTAEALGRYVGLFHDRMVGLTGTAEQIAEIAEAYRVYYARLPSEHEDHYLMDHSAFVYLMGPDGENLTIFARGVPPDRMAEELARHIGLPSPDA